MKSGSFILFFFALLTSKLTVAASVKTLRLNDESVAQVLVSTQGTVLSFPIKPTKVILGKAGSFGIEYVENDLAISPLSPSSRSHLFVYLFGRRFTFELIASSSDGNTVIQVRDSHESIEAPLKPPGRKNR